MKSWQILKQAIPRGASEQVAHKLHVSADLVRRWRREQLSEDAPLESGKRSPLDRICDLLDEVFLVNPQGAHLIASAVQDHYEGLAERHAPRAALNVKAAAALKETVEAVNSINLEDPLERIETEVEEAHAAITELKRHLRVAYCARKGTA
jgi:hypothetical protein